MKTSPLEKRMIAAFWRSLEATYHKNDVVGAERVIPGAHGGIRVLYYAPPRPRGPVPVFFDLHGGGFIAGRPEMDDAFCDRLRRALNIAVIGVDYPLAPEKPYPADKEDVYDAVRYVFHHPEEFGADAANFSIGGHSAGGN
ncbi:MAG: alpha/beta hydrolase fold domain-containing protein, partial [Clostridia bacterium]|nr:alpha/beta hydrolase fold domain-containing protein [Clostridia bacterium]